MPDEEGEGQQETDAAPWQRSWRVRTPVKVLGQSTGIIREQQRLSQDGLPYLPISEEKSRQCIRHRKKLEGEQEELHASRGPTSSQDQSTANPTLSAYLERNWRIRDITVGSINGAEGLGSKIMSSPLQSSTPPKFAEKRTTDDDIQKHNNVMMSTTPLISTSNSALCCHPQQHLANPKDFPGLEKSSQGPNESTSSKTFETHNISTWVTYRRRELGLDPPPKPIKRTGWATFGSGKRQLSTAPISSDDAVMDCRGFSQSETVVIQEEQASVMHTVATARPYSITELLKMAVVPSMPAEPKVQTDQHRGSRGAGAPTSGVTSSPRRKQVSTAALVNCDTLQPVPWTATLIATNTNPQQQVDHDLSPLGSQPRGRKSSLLTSTSSTRGRRSSLASSSTSSTRPSSRDKSQLDERGKQSSGKVKKTTAETHTPRNNNGCEKTENVSTIDSELKIFASARMDEAIGEQVIGHREMTMTDETPRQLQTKLFTDGIPGLHASVSGKGKKPEKKPLAFLRSPSPSLNARSKLIMPTLKSELYTTNILAEENLGAKSIVSYKALYGATEGEVVARQNTPALGVFIFGTVEAREENDLQSAIELSLQEWKKQLASTISDAINVQFTSNAMQGSSRMYLDTCEPGEGLSVLPVVAKGFRRADASTSTGVKPESLRPKRTDPTNIRQPNVDSEQLSKKHQANWSIDGNFRLPARKGNSRLANVARTSLPVALNKQAAPITILKRPLSSSPSDVDKTLGMIKPLLVLPSPPLEHPLGAESNGKPNGCDARRLAAAVVSPTPVLKTTKVKVGGTTTHTELDSKLVTPRGILKREYRDGDFNLPRDKQEDGRWDANNDEADTVNVDGHCDDGNSCIKVASRTAVLKEAAILVPENEKGILNGVSEVPEEKHEAVRKEDLVVLPNENEAEAMDKISPRCQVPWRPPHISKDKFKPQKKCERCAVFGHLARDCWEF